MDRLSEIRARCEAATPGPWKIGRQSPIGAQNVGTLNGVLTAQTTSESNAAFIAHSRDDIPYLLDRLEKTGAENRWIPVGEGLPKDSEPVYVYCPTGCGSVEATMGMMARAHKYSGYTHWMPRAMPEPPKGE